MFYYAIACLLIAFINAILGFGILDGTPALLAKYAFGVFLLVFVATLTSLGVDDSP